MTEERRRALDALIETALSKLHNALEHDGDTAGYSFLPDEEGRAILQELVESTLRADAGGPPEPTGVVHELKCWPEYFSALLSGDKTFEARKNDRNYGVGDVLYLREWDVSDPGRGFAYTGRSLRRRVTSILDDENFGVKQGYCVMSLGVDGGQVESPETDKPANPKEHTTTVPVDATQEKP